MAVIVEDVVARQERERLLDAVGGGPGDRLEPVSDAPSSSCPRSDVTKNSRLAHSTPLGVPVVPPVEIITRSSDDGLVAPGASGAADASAAS
jgi:hypothetical protein